MGALGRLKRAVMRAAPSGFYFAHRGHCPCCDSDAGFLATNAWLRDSLRCLNCGSIPRQRALLVVLEQHFPDWRQLRIHESSPSWGGALERECAGYVATQFHPDRPPGSMVDGFRNENLERQTFEDAAFDVVVTQDVFEHLYDPAAAFREIARTLRPGGAHVFTVPLVNKHRPTEIWAARGANREPVFIGAPEYHDNPVDPRGSPVTMHWGFDIVDAIESASGLETTIEHLDDLDRGIRAEYIEVLVSRKAGG